MVAQLLQKDKNSKKFLIKMSKQRMALAFGANCVH